MKKAHHLKHALCVAVALCTLCAPAASAKSSTIPNDAVYSTTNPRFVAMSKLLTELSISSSGRATCTGHAYAISGYTCDSTLELQQKNGFSWKTIKTWSTSAQYANFNETRYVTSGYTYRLKLSADVFNSNGVLVESVYDYSTQASY